MDIFLILLAQVGGAWEEMRALSAWIGRTLYAAAVAFTPGGSVPRISSASVRFAIR